MYKTVVIDPPWKKSTGGVGHATLQPSTHYDVQTRGQIVNTIEDSIQEATEEEFQNEGMWL